jgi:hypothetical protein
MVDDTFGGIIAKQLENMIEQNKSLQTFSGIYSPQVAKHLSRATNESSGCQISNFGVFS